MTSSPWMQSTGHTSTHSAAFSSLQGDVITKAKRNASFYIDPFCHFIRRELLYPFPRANSLTGLVIPVLFPVHPAFKTPALMGSGSSFGSDGNQNEGGQKECRSQPTHWRQPFS